VIEEIRRLMLRSAQEVVSKGKLKEEACKSSRAEQQQQSSGAGGQLQRRVWDPGGFQQSWEAHEKELMNFSQQWSMMQEHHSTSATAPAIQHIKVHSRRGEAPTLSFFPHFQISICI
jgi:hypothetical protein